MGNFKILICVCALSLFLLFPAFKLQAAYKFNLFTNNTAYCNDLNINMEVSDAGLNNVDFTFHNISQIESSIANIYFEDGSLLSIAEILEGPGTKFGDNPKPSNLPSAQNLIAPFKSVTEFSIGAISPKSKNGINPSERLTIRFDLKTGSSYQSIISELSSCDLRVGLHIIGLPEGSESAVNDPRPIEIPEPAAMGILAIGGLMLRMKK